MLGGALGKITLLPSQPGDVLFAHKSRSEDKRDIKQKKRERIFPFSLLIFYDENLICHEAILGNQKAYLYLLAAAKDGQRHRVSGADVKHHIYYVILTGDLLCFAAKAC